MSEDAGEKWSEQGSISQPPVGELGSLGNRVVEDAKFQLGSPPVPFDGLPLPWSYGDNRITAMVRSPDSLYLYWEITDEGIADARRRLGPAGNDGWCNLRVYDTTGREFDGVNANDYFDVTIQRGDREYFLNLHRPTASFHVEVGIKSTEGYFQAIARSGRADFPRKGPSPSHALEWMTVTSDDNHPTSGGYASKYSGPPPGSGPPYVESRGDGGGAIGQPKGEVRTFTWAHPARAEVRWEGPWISGGWRTEWRLRWVGGREVKDLTGGHATFPIENAQWVAGPFAINGLDAHHAGRFEVRFLGDGQVVLEHASGLEVFGPWEVRIQSFETGAERRTLGAWKVHWIRVEPTRVERWWSAFERARVSAWAEARAMVGASDARAVAWGGASEMWRMGASELWAGGASEWMAMGASEVARVGASELLYGGASALLYGGASAMVWGGASEYAWGGASEWMHLGASERGGASEWIHGGASEHAHLGASESLYPAASEWLASQKRQAEVR